MTNEWSEDDKLAGSGSNGVGVDYSGSSSGCWLAVVREERGRMAVWLAPMKGIIVMDRKIA